METKILQSSNSSQSNQIQIPKKEADIKPGDVSHTPSIGTVEVKKDKILPRKALTAYQIFTRDMMKTMKDDPRLQHI